MFHIKVLSAKELMQFNRELAQMRIDYFSEFPYLYKGKLQDEIDYISSYSNIKHAVIIAALTKEGELAGFASAQPLQDNSQFSDKLLHKFEANHYETADFYYFSETIIKKSFQEQGLYKKLLEKEQICAKQFGYQNTCFMAIEREQNHLLRPKDYKDLEPMFEHTGYYKTEISIELAWDTLQKDGSYRSQKNCLSFWFEKLDRLKPE